MGKRKRSGLTNSSSMGKQKQQGKKKNVSFSLPNDCDDDVDASGREFMMDEVDSFHDDGNILLHKEASKKKKVEEEVFGLGSFSDDDDSDAFDFGEEDGSDESDKEIDMGSDIDDKDDNQEMPSAKAWGKRTKNFYKTDFVDPDWSGGFNVEEQEIAEMEEKEAIALQKKMAEELNAADFDLGFYQPAEKKPRIPVREEKVEKDFSNMTKEECIELLKQESPELMPLIKDNREKVEEFTRLLTPLVSLLKDDSEVPSATKKYLNLRYQLFAAYLTNLQFYFLLKSRRAVVNRHPVMKRLAQYRKLIELLSPADELFQPQIQDLVTQLEKKSEAESTNLNKLKQSSKSYLRKATENRKSKKKNVIKILDDLVTEKDSESGESDEEEEEEKGEENVEDEEESTKDEEKRAITYQIAKNKGLTPYRKKEYKNPRVKHRIKFRKAVIRRKGAVRAPRTEVEKYGGELSGIRAGVVKSVKLA